jgi:hypothetical protein
MSNKRIEASMISIDGCLFSIETNNELIEGAVYFEPDHGTTFTVLNGGQLMSADNDPGWSAAPKVFLELIQDCPYKNNDATEGKKEEE